MLGFHPYFDGRYNQDVKHALASLYPKGNPLVLISVRVWVDLSVSERGQKDRVT
jgi:hypothetical protein